MSRMFAMMQWPWPNGDERFTVYSPASRSVMSHDLQVRLQTV